MNIEIGLVYFMVLFGKFYIFVMIEREIIFNDVSLFKIK